jgi:hypothetical protein
MKPFIYTSSLSCWRLRVSRIVLIYLIFFAYSDSLQAEFLKQLPRRCQRAVSEQQLLSPSYLLAVKPAAIVRRLRRCRTYARKKFIKSDTVLVKEFSGENARIIPAAITIPEQSVLRLNAQSDREVTEDSLYLWTIRYKGGVYFSTKPNFAARFPDDAHMLLRLWIRNKTSGTVEKHMSIVTVENEAPTIRLSIPEYIQAGRSTIIKAIVEDKSLADTRAGFTYLWQAGNRSFNSQEGIHELLEVKFKNAGTHKIAIQVSDKDGGTTFLQEEITVHPKRKGKTTIQEPDVEPKHTPPARTTTPESAPDNEPPTNQLATDALAQAIERWEEQMEKFGTQHCTTLADESTDSDHRLGTTYYDAQWVYYQIAAYTGNSKWITCAQHAERAYRDGYVKEWDGRVPGYWNFTHGLLEDFLQTGDIHSRDALIQISHAAAYAADTTPLEWTRDVELSREVAYAIMSYINAEKAGSPRRERLTALHAQAHGHMQQWFKTNSAPYIRPFMVALTAQALIEYDEWIGDATLIQVLRQALDHLWEETWLSQEQTFQYTDREHETGGTEPAYDLNLLIAPVFAWLFKETGETHYRDKADIIFIGGIKNAWLSNGKQFNQNYRWAFHYLRWRAAN